MRLWRRQRCSAMHKSSLCQHMHTAASAPDIPAHPNDHAFGACLHAQVALYIFSPEQSYAFSELLESHAVDTYGGTPHHIIFTFTIILRSPHVTLARKHSYVCTAHCAVKTQSEIFSANQLQLTMVRA